MSHHLPAVCPAVDYEPPATRVDVRSAPSSDAFSHVPVRRRGIVIARSEPAVPVAAHTFADAALRCVLEVLDRRRQVGQLRPLMPQAIVDVVASIAQSRSRASAAAVLRRVRLRATDVAPTAAEVFATYTRGDRVGAIAARVELAPTSTGVRWQLTALHLG